MSLDINNLPPPYPNMAMVMSKGSRKISNDAMGASAENDAAAQGEKILAEAISVENASSSGEQENADSGSQNKKDEGTPLSILV